MISTALIFNLGDLTFELKIYVGHILGSGRGSVSRAVASNSKGPQFESSRKKQRPLSFCKSLWVAMYVNTLECIFVVYIGRADCNLRKERFRVVNNVHRSPDFRSVIGQHCPDKKEEHQNLDHEKEEGVGKLNPRVGWEQWMPSASVSRSIVGHESSKL